MKLKLIYAFALLFTITIFSATAQSSNKKESLKLVKYRDNVKAPLTIIEKGMLEEVFASKFEEYILKRPQALKNYKHLLRNRIQIINMPDLVECKEKYQLLSEVGLFNDYNKDLKIDKGYNAQNFNILKYNVRIHGRGSSLYRIDNSNYFVIIKSQHQ